MNKIFIIISLLLLAFIGVVMRLVPHPANFTPVFAIALFAGFYLSKKWSLILPLAIMLIGDFFIGFYDWKLMLVVYGSIALAGLIGLATRNNRNIFTVATATLLASIVFFLTTNLAVWYFSSWYSHDWTGLFQCYTLAVPFFKNSLLGDLFFVSLFFGGYEAIKMFVAQKVVLLSSVKSK
ncbi:MAG: hypothetical protein UV78_C0008G0011 [Parcubacteria group bacterium GW2011_GWA2_43_17]|nr:MAG: hypothetical protein UV78_C0008G0011 [Parcubacteria group bacterium GW2011_GWA2_43_17]KKT94116.1 MAG: hypothetical protein UW91_C0005G0009 [Parcubacteria group bacterium GW2011_GWF2_45_11]KKT96498.1 MAG: hypothetical protein UW98_C0041G0003 [Parcubacteria group bacterium GW2011_GWC2_45_15]OGY92440.1 MAG: hypothetical protein A2260_04155 [Candidatus Komeilibacteria bacterium RIFOXYA2_FULL_45_9]OGY94761.1 MAG: hypothetical protein A3J95_01230 [Candidatus Komeilibacteria bacterium RIFOXYC2